MDEHPDPDPSVDVVGDIIRRHAAKQAPAERVECLNCDGEGELYPAINGAVFVWTCPVCLGLGSIGGARKKEAT